MTDTEDEYPGDGKQQFVDPPERRSPTPTLADDIVVYSLLSVGTLFVIVAVWHAYVVPDRRSCSYSSLARSTLVLHSSNCTRSCSLTPV